MMAKLTLGRTVHFLSGAESDRGVGYGILCAAVVTDVQADGSPVLHAFHPSDASMDWIVSGISEGVTPGTWQWPTRD